MSIASSTSGSLARAGWISSIGLLVRMTFSQWLADKAPRLGAALAYYTVFSLAPLLVIALAVAAAVFGRETAQQEMQTQLESIFGKQGAGAVQSLLVSASEPGVGTWAALLGLVTLLFGASGVFGELQDSLNTIWQVPPQATGGVWRFLRSRFLSFAMVLGVGFLLLVSLVLSTAVSALFGQLEDASGWLLQTANAVTSFGLITVLFAMIFKVLPDTPIAWRDVWLGAAFTALLFTIGKQLIGMYLGRASVSSAYGAAGSVVIVLLWSYYSAQILYLGAEFTRAFATQFGSQASSTPPSDNRA